SRVLLVLAVVSVGRSAFGAVRLDGNWPETDKLISLDASALPRSEAVRRIADAAGWNVVWASPSTEPIDVHVKKQPATKVLELVLSDGDYVARRQGDLIQTSHDQAAAAPPAVAPNPPAPSAAPDAAADEDDDEPAPSPPPHGARSHG